MKKILISAVIVSSVLMSGDLAKCTEAAELAKKFSALADEMSTLSENISGVLMDKEEDLLEREKAVYTRKINHANMETQRNIQMFQQWHNMAKKECKGLLSEEVYKYYYN